MPAIRMAIIDGTGPAQGYEEAMKHSFCKQLDRSSGQYVAFYQRGPTAMGMEVMDLSFKAADWLRQEKRRTPDAKLMLAGYSRGGSAVILAAELLANAGHDVDALFLFDAVARHVYAGGEVIPARVKFSRHARRSQNVSFVLKYEGTISDYEKVGTTLSNPTRPSFSNTGLEWRGAGDHERARAFMGTHGALGGVGWSFVTEDPGCQEAVADWMNGHLRARGVPVELKSHPPVGGKKLEPGVAAYIVGAGMDLLMLAGHAKTLVMGGRKYLP